MDLSRSTKALTTAIFIWLASDSPVSAQMDLGQDGLGDFWQLHYQATALAAEVDFDGDGQSNAHEELAGTNPLDPSSYLTIETISLTDDQISIHWQGTAGKQYAIESSNDLITWIPGALFISSGGAESVNLTADLAPQFYRVSVRDVDSDGDGLTDYEERLLGYDPFAMNSTGTVSGGDFAAAVSLVTSGQEFSLGGQGVSGELPSPEAASRFLVMATLGANRAEIAAVEASGFSAWIDAQFASPAGRILPELQQRDDVGLDVFSNHKRHAWWRQVMTSDDLLRQRIAFALSQIWVISDRQLGSIPLGMASYYDMLLENSFSNARDILFDVAMHPTMGAYLSHLRNRKPDPAENRFSDENFAREIMQLFSIGLFELNQDGTRRQTPEGEDIPTYNNETITNFARIFTGLTYAADGQPDMNDFFWGTRNFIDPMEMYEGEHDTDAKILLNGITLPAFADAPGRTGMDDINAAIDNLFNHPNIGPFLGRLLIQQLVKSNPSPTYIARVSAAFADNGLGVRGDLRAIIRAILLDPEAIVLPAADDPHSGKLREPFVRYARLLRTFDASSENGNFANPEWNTSNDLGQLWFSSPSVFNFFSPNHNLGDTGLVAPEFQILTSVTAISAQNFYNRVIQEGAIQWATGADQIFLNLDDELLLANNPAALMDHLDLLLTYGSLSESSRQTITSAITQIPEANALFRVQTAVRLIVLSPDFAIFR